MELERNCKMSVTLNRLINWAFFSAILSTILLSCGSKRKITQPVNGTWIFHEWELHGPTPSELKSTAVTLFETGDMEYIAAPRADGFGMFTVLTGVGTWHIEPENGKRSIVLHHGNQNYTQTVYVIGKNDEFIRFIVDVDFGKGLVLKRKTSE